MSSDKYKKGTQLYESVYWLLKHYYEFKFYNIAGENEVVRDIMESEKISSYSISDVIVFTEKGDSCTRRMKSVMDYIQSDYCVSIVKIMDNAYKRLEARGGHCIMYSQIIKKRFMSKNKESEEIKIMHNSYYEYLKRAVEMYCEMFSNIIRRNRSCFSDIHTEEDIIKEVALLKKVYRMHSHGGVCYKDTEKLLKNYKEIKYLGVQERIGDSSESIEYFLCNNICKKNEYEKALDRIDYISLPDSMKKWMYSSMLETTNAYLCFVDEALRRMNWLGEKGKEYRALIDILFIDPQWYGRRNEEKLNETGFTLRKFYERRRKAIEMLSKILWGVLAHRHCESVFYGKCVRNTRNIN